MKPRNRKPLPTYYQCAVRDRSARKVKPPLRLIPLRAPLEPRYATEPVFSRPVLPGLSRAESKILKRVADGWHVIIGNGLRLWRPALTGPDGSVLHDAVLGGKVKWAAVLSLLRKGYLDAQVRLTRIARSLVDHYREKVQAPLVQPAKRVLTFGTALKPTAADLLRPAVARLK